MENKKKYLIFISIAIGVIFLDQLTKSIVLAKFNLYDSTEVISGFLNLVHVRNPGAAFGFLSNMSDLFRSFFFIGVGSLAGALILYCISKMKIDETKLLVSLSLVFSGAVGNTIDRVRFGEVIDFIDAYVSSFHWPAFNVADSAISIGALFLVLELFRRRKKR